MSIVFASSTVKRSGKRSDGSVRLEDTTAEARGNAAVDHPAADKLFETGSGAGRTVATFEIAYRQYLDLDGDAVADMPGFALDPEILVPIYRTMMLTRLFDAKAVSMQRTGQLGTYPSSLGQEAVTVGLASAMRPEDVLLPTYREHGALHWRGVTMEEMLLYWSGDERGLDWQVPREDFPPAIPIATQTLHAAGVAAAFKIRSQPRVAVAVLGDGATSKGDFYEAMNVAGAWDLPVVFVINNNQWAISVPRGAQTAAETLAQKAIAGGLPAEQVDGNDAIAVHAAVSEAIERARSGGGAGVVEAITYRLSDHTTADDATRYRSEDEVSAMWKREPLSRLRAWLGNNGWWSKAQEEELIEATKARIEAAREAVAKIPPQKPTDIFDDLYARLPPSLEIQRTAIGEADYD